MSVNGGPNRIESGLVFSLDAADRTSYSGGTTWYDLVGNNNGTLTNGPTFYSENFGGFDFDGTNDYLDTSYQIEAASSSTLQTLCSWVYGVFTNNSFFGSGANSIGKFHIILNYQSNSSLRFGESYYGGGAGALDQTNIVSITPNSTWNYACIVKTAQYTYDVYFNGKRIIIGATKAATLPAPLNLGRWWSGQYVRSRTALVQGYNRALSEQEILQNYNVTKSRFGL